MSSEDLLTKFDQLAQRFQQEFQELIEEERVKLKAEIAEYNAEKERMKALTVSDNDIIHLNIGGQKLTTKRSTLCQVENSLLATMFSGRWEESLERDQDGAVFLDFNPQYFVLILDYLREKRIAQLGKPIPLPKVADDQLERFNNLLQYLGLNDEIVPKQITPSEKFGQHSSGVTVQESGSVAVKGPEEEFRYILGENLYRQGIVNLKLKLESFQSNLCMFAGIVKGDVVPPDDFPYRWRGSYGWVLGRYGQMWKDGKATTESALNNVTKQGDTVNLILGYDAAKLSLHLPNGQQFHIEIPKSQTWRLNVGLYDSNDKIRIMNE